MERSSSKTSFFYLQRLSLIAIILTMVAGCNYSKPLSLKPEETIKARLHLDKAGPFHIGDSIPLILTVEARKGVSYQLPEFDESTSGGLELKSKQPFKTEVYPQGIRQRTLYVMAGWHAGQFKIPATTIAYQTSSEQRGTIKIAPMTVKLSSVLPKGISEAELLTFNIKGICSPLGLEPRYSVLKYFLLGALILILVGVLLLFYRRSLLQGQNASKAEKEPAHIIALRRLAGLKTMEFSDPASFKIFYFELSECIREYMENRYSIRALEMTTEEFLMRLTTGAFLNSEQQLLLKDFMQQSDLVKFANHFPSIEEAEKDLGHIEQLVETTKEIPVQSEISEAAPVQTTF